MPMRRGVKSRKEVATKTLREFFLIENPLKKRRTLNIVYLFLEIEPGSLGQNIEHIFHKHRHEIRNMQEPSIFSSTCIQN
jgi:hypothetical protein